MSRYEPLSGNQKRHCVQRMIATPVIMERFVDVTGSWWDEASKLWQRRRLQITKPGFWAPVRMDSSPHRIWNHSKWTQALRTERDCEMSCFGWEASTAQMKIRAVRGSSSTDEQQMPQKKEFSKGKCVPNPVSTTSLRPMFFSQLKCCNLGAGKIAQWLRACMT